MKKVYGYKSKDLFGLMEYLDKNKTKPKSTCFKEFAQINGKAKGTVRNMYYALMKNSLLDDELKNEYLKDKKIDVNKAKPFSKEEEDKIINYVLNAKKEGISVRKATANLSNGDMKLALRYQNKFRNCLKKDDQLKQKFYGEDCEMDSKYFCTEKVKGIVSSVVFDTLVTEITNLMRKISFDVIKENEYLKQMLEKLKYS